MSTLAFFCILFCVACVYGGQFHGFGNAQWKATSPADSTEQKFYLEAEDKEFQVSWVAEQPSFNSSRIYNNSIPTGDSYLKFTVQFNPMAVEHKWFALAFHPEKTTMKNTDMAFFTLLVDIDSKNGKDRVYIEPSLSDRWTEHGGTPELDLERGGTEDYVNFTCKYVAPPKNRVSILKKFSQEMRSIKCDFYRKFDTGDKYDLKFGNYPIRMSWAHGAVTLDPDNQLAPVYYKHQGTVRGWTLNVLNPEPYLNVGKPQDSSWKQWNRIVAELLASPVFWHALLMLLAWWVFMIPGSILARYFKWAIPTWYFKHWKMQLTGVFFAFAGFVTILSHKNWEFPDVLSWSAGKEKSIAHMIHTFVGTLVVLILLPSQVILGYLSNKLWYAGKPPHFWPDKLHWIVAWFGVIAAGGLLQFWAGAQIYTELMSEAIGASTGIDPSKLFRTVKLSFWVVTVFGLIGLILLEVSIGQKHEHELDSNSNDISSSYEEPSEAEDERKRLLVSSKVQESTNDTTFPPVEAPSVQKKLSTGLRLAVFVFAITWALVIFGSILSLTGLY